jgi:hypothetical protein
MPWSDFPLQTLVIPGDAGPNDPRIVITSDPADLIPDAPYAALIAWFWNATDFFFIGVTPLGALGILEVGAFTATSGNVFIFHEYNADSITDERPHAMFAQNAAGDGSIISMIEGLTLSAEGLVRLRPNTSGSGDLTIRQGISDVSASRGSIGATRNGAAIAGILAEAVVDTLTAETGEWAADRLYRIQFCGQIVGTVAGDRVGIRIRRDTVAGVIERDCGQITLGPIGIPSPIDVWTLYEGRQIVGEAVVLTVRRAAGGGTFTYTPDSGLATDQTTDTL